jgi:putative NADPH-quinone reductase
MKKILILYAHPSPQRSRVNRHLLTAASKTEGIEVRDLYELYPAMHIDVPAEQDALRQADIVVFQFPIFWFSSPAILKEWQDMVLTGGFAYGEGGHALKDKGFMLSVTSGGSKESYTKGAKHGAEIGAYLAPFEQTARFCDMTLLDSFVVQNASALDSEEIAGIVKAYKRRLEALKAG